jgi:hypothetical protein
MSQIVLSPTVNAAPAEPTAPDNFTTSATFPFCLDAVVVGAVQNDPRGPTKPCEVQLQLSQDGGQTFAAVKDRRASIGAGKLSYLGFILADYAEQAAWDSCQLVFGRNRGTDCTVWAYADGSCLSGTGPYAAPAFTAFAISGQATTLEVGASVTAGSHTFTWATSNSANVKPNSITITDSTGSVVLASGLANTGSDAITLSAITHDAPSAQVWTITGINTQGQTFSRQFTVVWDYRLYWGDSASTTLDSAGVAGLANSVLQAGPAGTFAITSGVNYKYFAYPDAMGDIASVVDPSTGFPIALELATPYDNFMPSGIGYDLVSVTNTLSVAANYRVLRTQYPIGGALTMKVS